MVLCCMSVCVWGGGVLRCFGAVFVMLVWFCAVCECECVWGGGGGLRCFGLSHRSAERSGPS